METEQDGLAQHALNRTAVADTAKAFTAMPLGIGSREGGPQLDKSGFVKTKPSFVPPQRLRPGWLLRKTAENGENPLRSVAIAGNSAEIRPGRVTAGARVG